MPIIYVNMIKGRTREQKKEMVIGVTEVVSKSLNCSKEAVKIIIRDLDHDDYADGGVLWSDLKK